MNNKTIKILTLMIVGSILLGYGIGVYKAQKMLDVWNEKQLATNNVPCFNNPCLSAGVLDYEYKEKIPINETVS